MTTICNIIDQKKKKKSAENAGGEQGQVSYLIARSQARFLTSQSHYTAVVDLTSRPRLACMWNSPDCKYYLARGQWVPTFADGERLSVRVNDIDEVGICAVEPHGDVEVDEAWSSWVQTCPT